MSAPFLALKPFYGIQNGMRRPANWRVAVSFKMSRRSHYLHSSVGSIHPLRSASAFLTFNRLGSFEDVLESNAFARSKAPIACSRSPRTVYAFASLSQPSRSPGSLSSRPARRSTMDLIKSLRSSSLNSVAAIISAAIGPTSLTSTKSETVRRGLPSDLPTLFACSTSGFIHGS